MYAKNLSIIMRFSATSITTEPVLSPEHCGQLIHQYGKDLDVPGIGARPAVNKGIRKTLAKAINSSDNPELYDLVVNAARQVNSTIWQYSLEGMDKLQLLKYNVGGHYGWHLDIGGGEHMYRKLSFVIPLSPPKNYEGGELIVKTSPKDISVPLVQRKMILFPSFILHKVTPVTKGERYMLVGWLRGNKPLQ